MILYERPLKALDADESHALRLRQINPEKPVAASARRAVEALITPEWLADRGPIRMFDIGSRDGTVTAELQQLVEERATDGEPPQQPVGLDPDSESIEQAEHELPSMTWINDSLDAFLDRSEVSAPLEGGFDLIVDRGYPLLIDTPEQAEREAQGIAHLLAPGGIVVQVISRTAFADWSHLACVGWTRSLFEIRDAALGSAVRVDDAACYVTIFGVDVDAGAPGMAITEPLPREVQIQDIEFELSDGRRVTWSVFDNEGMQLRAWHHGVRAGLLAPYRFRVLPGTRDSVRAAEAALLERANAAWTPGRPAVMDPSGSLIGPRGRRVSYRKALYDRLLGDGFNVLHYPRDCRDRRDYRDSVNEWIAALPDLVVLGPGMIDSRHDPNRDGGVVTDLDQFRHMVGWVIERLQEEAGVMVAWVHFGAPPPEVLAGGSIRAEDIETFAAAAREVAEGRGVSVTDVPYERIAPRGTPDLALAADEVASVIRDVIALPVGGRA
jgi:hypothetical protein